MRKDPLPSSPDELESPVEKFLRQERALMASINAAAESPIEKLIRQQVALIGSLKRASESVRVFDRIQESIDKMNAATRVFRALDKPFSIYEKFQQSFAWFDRIQEQMTATSAIQRHIGSLLAESKRFQAVTSTVSSALETLKKHDKAMRAVVDMPGIEDTLAKVTRQFASILPVPAIGIGFEKCAEMVARLDKIDKTILTDVSPSAIATEKQSEKTLEEECKEAVDAFMLADGDYFQAFGNLLKPHPRVRKIIQYVLLIHVLIYIYGSIVSDYEAFAKLIFKRQLGCYGKARVVDNYFVVSPHRLNIRSAPGMNGRIIATLSKGQTVRVIYKTRRWANVVVEVQNKEKIVTGFVAGKYLKPTRPKPFKAR